MIDEFSNPPVSKMFPASYVCQGFEVKSEGALGVGPAFRIAIPAMPTMPMCIC